MTKQLLRALVCCFLVFSARGQCGGETTLVTCTVTDVASYDDDRVHVRCSNKQGTIEYFAVPINPAGAATRLAAAGIAALQNPDWKLHLHYCPNDLSGENIGCHVGNCRLVMAFVLER